MLSSVIYFLADYYPWWGLPLAFILFELANYHRRHGGKPKMVVYATASLMLLGLTVVYVVYDGFANLRPGMRNIEKTYLEK